MPKIKEEIDQVKKERSDVIIRIKDSRRRLSYKEAESVAIATLLKMEKDKAQGKEDEKRRKIGYLKKMKNTLEFKIATEASSLAAEKELVRKIEQINKELNEAYKVVRLERKADLIKSDIEQYRKILTESEAKITEMDKKLDELYDKLRKLLGIERGKHMKPQQLKERRKPQPMPVQEINLEDIAVIKKKEKKAVDDEEGV